MRLQYRSSTVRKETLHTVSLVLPHLSPGTSVLDVGCGEGYVGEALAASGAAEVQVVDFVDVRRVHDQPFALYDGVRLPFADQRFDVVMLNFVLHHVPDDDKIALLGEALRVARRLVFVLEDTPTNALDRFMSHRHGEAYRRKIESSAPFGFLSPREWRWLFRGMGVRAESRALGRFSRSVLQPFARTAFVLHKPAVAAAATTGATAAGEVVRNSPRRRDESWSRPTATG
jgi:SAM-dependent methyltransferase